MLQLYDIMSDMQYRTTRTGATLFDALHQARTVHGGSHRILDDIRRRPLSYDRIMVGAMAFGRLLARETEIGERVGLLLPNMSASAVTFFALLAFGRVPAMLNYSAKTANLKAATHAAQIRIIVTSRTFVERADLEPAVSALGETSRVLWLEDLKDQDQKSLHQVAQLMDHHQMVVQLN